MTTQQNTSSAATNIHQLLDDLDGGNLEHKLSVALSQVAAAVVDTGGCGEVTLKFKVKPIPGSHQVGCENTVEFKRPTMSGMASERDTRTTVLFVGKFGSLSLAQPQLFKDGQQDLART